MRKSNTKAAETRRAIVMAAADHIRRTGIADATVADVMAAAGLTHGGFYKHFRNKEHLAADALVTAGAASADMLQTARAKGGRDAALDRFLSLDHRGAATPHCPLVALGSEIGRSSGEIRTAAAAVIEETIDALVGDPSSDEARGEALVDYAAMVGAMTLARIISDTAQAEDLLDRVKKRLRR